MKGYLAALLSLTTVLALAQSPGQVQGAPFSLGKPVVSGRLQVIPILARDPGKTNSVSLLDAARSGLVRISDYMGGSTSQVVVSNGSKDPVTLLAGALLDGGHQDQTVTEDINLAPGETALVQVFCVEPGRSSGPTASFKPNDTMVPDWIRSIEARYQLNMLSKGDAQKQVWAEVGQINASQGKRPRTGTIRGTVDDPELRQSVSDVAARLATETEDSSNVVGTIVTMNGRIYSADFFGSHTLYDQFRGNLLRTYALTAFLATGDQEPMPGEAACQDFLSEITEAGRVGVAKSKGGTRYRLASSGVLGIESGSTNFAGGVGSAGFVHGFYLAGN